MKSSLLSVLLLASIYSYAAFADQKTGQQTTTPPQSQSDRDHKYCHEECTIVSADGSCHYESICR
jgi:hypothetical protein